MLIRYVSGNVVARALLVVLVAISTVGCECPESIPLDQPVVVGAPRLAEITVVNGRPNSIRVLPVNEDHDALDIEPGGSETFRATVDRVTTPREWTRHADFDLLSIELEGAGAILITLGPVEYFIAEGADRYVLRVDVGEGEPWRVGVIVDVSAMSTEKPTKGELTIADDDLVELRIP